MNRWMAIGGVVVAACGADSLPVDSGETGIESTDRAGCAGEPLSIEGGLPDSVWVGTRQGFDAAGALLQEGLLTIDIEDNAVLTEFTNASWFWMALDTFRFDATGIAWLGLDGHAIGACTVDAVDVGTLRCTITDPAQAVQGEKDLAFSTDCLWIDERLTLDGTEQRAHAVLAPAQ